MKRLVNMFLFATVFCLMASGICAQNVTYLDENYKPATPDNYTYKRVIKYKEPLVNWNLGTDIYGNWTVNPQPVMVYICSMTDYYKTGERALIGNKLSTDISCSKSGGLHGQVVSYYRNGNTKLKTSWKYGKLDGTAIEYNEDGTEKERAEYVDGKLIEENKFAVAADNPLIGRKVERPNTSNNIYGPWGNYENMRSAIINMFCDKIDRIGKVDHRMRRFLKEDISADRVDFGSSAYSEVNVLIANRLNEFFNKEIFKSEDFRPPKDSNDPNNEISTGSLKIDEAFGWGLGATGNWKISRYIREIYIPVVQSTLSKSQ